jgi:hypothetical protein
MSPSNLGKIEFDSSKYYLISLCILRHIMDQRKFMCNEHKRMFTLASNNWSGKCKYVGCGSDADRCRSFSRMIRHRYHHCHKFSTMACERHLCTSLYCHFPRTEYGPLCISHSNLHREKMVVFSLSEYGRTLSNDLMNTIHSYMSGGTRLSIGVVTDKFTSKHAFELTVDFTWRLTSRINVNGATDYTAIHHQTNGFVDLPLTHTNILLRGETYSVVLPANVSLPRKGTLVDPHYFFVYILYYFPVKISMRRGLRFGFFEKPR